MTTAYDEGFKAGIEAAAGVCTGKAFNASGDTIANALTRAAAAIRNLKPAPRSAVHTAEQEDSEVLVTWRAICEEAECVIDPRRGKCLVLTEEMCVRLGATIEGIPSSLAASPTAPVAQADARSTSDAAVVLPEPTMLASHSNFTGIHPYWNEAAVLSAVIADRATRSTDSSAEAAKL